ncbi:MAG: 2-C-methyl-D-erythritol 4-phosphate cytidylyltransferase [Bacteroidales bacterium]|nr:2-C-methyl-D-erythritol 4-phosphate cytidylyltransferase [Bacteroidales bacterium]MBN2755937.1 2-C-methyl-D-erythritol 4-phosphate cytidylyltransferase [Bacteroidales bacterium]
MTKFAIIVAAGSGERFSGNIPKQFVLLKGLPILMHSINAFFNFDNSIKIIVVLSDNQTHTWKELCSKYEFEINHKIVNGGQTRFESVKNGLSTINEDSLIAIHDGVRPLVSNTTIKNCFSTAQMLGNAIPVVEPVDSVREIGFNESFSLKRNNLRLIQTPQVFKTEILKIAYQQNYNSTFTDDANVVESIGEKINLVEGNIENIKITTNTDLIIAEALINNFE